MKFECYIARLDGKVLYVGEGKKNRHLHCNSGVSSSFQLNQLFFRGCRFDVEVIPCETKEEAQRLEEELVLVLRPKFNKIRAVKSINLDQIKKFQKKLLKRKTDTAAICVEYILNNTGADYTFLVNKEENPRVFYHLKFGYYKKGKKKPLLVSWLIEDMRKIEPSLYEFKLVEDFFNDPVSFLPKFSDEE